MPKIHILPEQLANRIAAGEVVERPASVVKELVENSLDAGADRIEVEIEGGGTRLIRVIDNGSGMDEDDVLLSLERHGTSKIRQPEDLDAITTLGFRGEAIPSIASVAKVTITSRPAGRELGTTAVVEFGRLQKVHESGCAQGTTIEVANLFGRTPARKKFLRTARTELGHIDDIVRNYALACPALSFTLRIDGRESLRLPGGQDIEARLRAVIRYTGNLITVGEAERERGGRRLHGLLLPPERSGGSSSLRMFINGRAIRDRLVSHAVYEGLRGFLLKGHAPAGYLHLTVPADEIDVNVHPAKHEVRFRNGGDIHQYIKQQVEWAMQRQQQQLQSAYFHARPQVTEPPPGNEERRHQPRLPDTAGAAAPVARAPVAPAPAPPLQQQRQMSFGGTIPRHQAYETRENDGATPSGNASDIERTAAGHGLQVIGRYKDLYIFCQAGDELIVIDQHAAHERLLYEQFRKQYLSGRLASQTLLFPETVELSPAQLEIVEQFGAELTSLGFAVAEFGGNTSLLSAVPALAGRRPPQEIFFDVLDKFGAQGGNRSRDGLLENILATMACKAAVKAGDALSLPEIEALLQKMAAADLFSHCPHGRPVFRSFSDSDIKKWFYRT